MNSEGEAAQEIQATHMNPIFEASYDEIASIKNRITEIAKEIYSLSIPTIKNG